MGADKPISTTALLALLARKGVEVGRFVSLAPGRAEVEVVTPEGSYTVTVVDPEP